LIGLSDGLTLWQIKHTEGVDFVIPAKDGMRVKIDARAFLDQKPDGHLLVAAERLVRGRTKKSRQTHRRDRLDEL